MASTSFRRVLCTWFAGVLSLLAVASITLAQAPPGEATLNPPEALPSSFSRYFPPVPGPTVAPHAPGYSLPLDLARVDNLALAEGLTPDQRTLLQRNGFVVLPDEAGEDVSTAYTGIKNSGDPVWVTADSVLHVYHLQFDVTLKDIEEQKLAPALQTLTEDLRDQSLDLYDQVAGDVKRAAGRNAVFFDVALTVLTRGESDALRRALPAELAPLSQAEVALIEAHAGLAESPLFTYKEDYSQYVPRGHYTQTELLKRYFKTMMWYGRLTFLLKGQDLSDDALVSAEEARLQTIQAAILAAQLYPGGPSRGADAPAPPGDLWSRLYTVTAFFVGFADDLTPLQYAQQLKQVAGAAFAWTKLADPAVYTALRDRLAALPRPRIYGGTGAVTLMPPFSRAQLGELLTNTQGLRFMGQRLLPDTFITQQLLFPIPGPFTGQGKPFTMEMTRGGPQRCWARGLDVMAVLGSARAAAILQQEGDTAYRDYAATFQKLRGEFSDLPPEQWTKTLYWGWLHALRPLLEPAGEGYPRFMRTAAWQDRDLRAALASWAQLRHDTILYVKQPYAPVATAMPMPPPEVHSRGYVEPRPEFYGRLLALTQATQEGLKALNVLPPAAATRLQAAVSLFQQLYDISGVELAGQPLTEAQYDFIRN